jgi:2-oxoglutarate dehydrogenase complex dehydrogenase (E1) component-like enzyme
MGDSHMKGYASELVYCLDNKFEVMGVVMRGARIQNIVQLCDQELNSLTKEDMVILWGGSNNVAKNETMNGLRHQRKFVNRKKNMNFILITAPHRYDLMDLSRVNEKIKVFNRKIHNNEVRE